MEIKGKTCKSVFSAFLGSQYFQYSGICYAEKQSCLLWTIAKKAKDWFCYSCNFIGVNGLKVKIHLAGSHHLRFKCLFLLRPRKVMLSKTGKKIQLTLSAGKIWDRTGPGAQRQEEPSFRKEAKAEIYIVIVFEIPKARVGLSYPTSEQQ